MDFRTQTTLLAAIVAVALGISLLLRSQRSKAFTLFSILCLSVASWYLAEFLSTWTGRSFWLRASIATAASVPAAALAFFLEFLGVSRRSAERGRIIAFLGAFAGLVVATTPLALVPTARIVVSSWVLGSLAISLSLLYRRLKRVPLRVEKARLAYLFGGGVVALLATALDFLPVVGIPFPPFGPLLSTLFLFFLAQTLQVYRLLDLHELLGKFITLTALAVILSAIYAGLVMWVGDQPGLFAFNTLIASLVILNLYEPLRARVEEWVIATLFRERFELLRTLTSLKARLSSVIDPLELARVVLDTLHESRRVTHASIYLLADSRPGFTLIDARGPAPTPFLDASAARGLLALARSGQKAVLLENLERRLIEVKRRIGTTRTTSAPTTGHNEEVARFVDEHQRLTELRSALAAMKSGICIPLLGADRVIGFLNSWDERVPESYSSDEIALMLEIAEQTATVVENSKLYERMKERDRLAALGEMAAGLAHEIRNPLGAIKGAAQFLDPTQMDGEEAEFLQVIIEEVDRLNGVVTQFLNYARPLKVQTGPVDVNDVIERTLRLIANAVPEGIALDSHLAPSLPLAQTDAEQLKQVVINLVQNAAQAMPTGGRITLTTSTFGDDAGGFRLRGRGSDHVELRIRDTGPGIPENQREHVFVPFFTTKEKGTGLGLAISQRIIRSHGGNISISSRVGEGTEFVIRLQAVEQRREAPADPPPVEVQGPPPPSRPSRVSRRRRKRMA